MVVILRPFAITGILTAARIKPLVLLLAYFKAFLTPEPVDSFELYKPALFPEFYCYPAITVPWMLNMQYEQIIDNRLIPVRLFGFIPLGTSGLP